MQPSFDPTGIEAGQKLIEDMTTNASSIQEQLLDEILKKNANTEYLRRFLDGHSDKELFKKKVPFSGYEDMKPYVDRIMNEGSSPMLICAEPISELIESSGTSSGKRNYIPTTEEQGRSKGLYVYLSHVVLKKYYALGSLSQGKTMFFLAYKNPISTPGGVPIRTATTTHLTTKTGNEYFTSPYEVIACQGREQCLYSHLLCGLVQREKVESIAANYASTFLQIIKFLEEKWQELCHNIRKGHISDWITDPDCRKAILDLILTKEMPDLADSIEVECKAKSWEGIVKKLWPNAKCIQVIFTGSMEQYLPVLQFYCSGLPLVALRYACSEGYFGLNLEPSSDPYSVSYTLLPSMAYYEFLPVDRTPKDEEIPDTDELVDLANVEVGKSYELIATTCAGAYRYKIGDILRVTGFYNNAPQFKFVGRKNMVLSVCEDKTSEEDLCKATTIALRVIEPLGIFLTDFSSYTDVSTFPGHYVVFWELSMRGNDDLPELEEAKMEECCHVLESSLDMSYRIVRNRRNVVGPLEIRVVKKGSFYQLMDFYFSQGASFGQYKTPKSIKSEEALHILNSRVVGKYFSKVPPKNTT